MPEQTHLQQLYSEVEQHTQRQGTTTYGMDPQQFAQHYEQLTGSKRYDMLNEGKIMRGAQILGDSADRLGNAIGANDAIGGLFESAAGLFTDKQTTLDTAHHAGTEMFGMAPSLLALAIPIPGVNLAVAGGLAGLDAYTDSREGGMSRKTAVGMGVVSGTLMAALPGVGKVSESFLRGLVNKGIQYGGAEGALAMGQRLGARWGMEGFGQGLMSKSMQSVVPYAGREVAQFGAGSIGDIATTVINPDLNLSDLMKEEMYIPILLGNTVFVAGDMTIIKPLQYVKGRMKADSLGNKAAQDAEIQKTLADDEKVQASLDEFRESGRFDEMLKTFDADSRAELASRFAAVEMADASHNIRNMSDASTSTFVDAFVQMSHASGLPYATLKTRALSIYNTLGADAHNPHRALQRAMKVMQAEQKRVYGEVPTQYKDNPDLLAVYKMREHNLKEGTEHIIYNDSKDGVTAVRKADGTILAYKGKRAVRPDEMHEMIGEHMDGIRVGEATYHADAEMMRMKAVVGDGVYGSKSVDTSIVNSIREVFKGLGIDLPVIIAAAGDIKVDPALKLLDRTVSSDGNVRASANFDMSKHFATITLNNGRLSSKNLFDLMHEVGHVYGKSLEARAGRALKPETSGVAMSFQAVRNIYEQYGVKAPLKESGPLIPEFQRIANATKVVDANGNVTIKKTPRTHKDIYPDGDVAFHEWFANQFARWTVKPDSKVSSITDSYFSHVVNAFRNLWQKLKDKFKLPEKHFDAWMDQQARLMYRNIVNDGTSFYNTWQKKYLLGDRGNDYLARSLYENRDPRYHALVEERLDAWVARGRKSKPETIIDNAIKKYELAPDFLGTQNSKHNVYSPTMVARHLYDQFKGQNMGQLHRITEKINSVSSVVDGMHIAQTLMFRFKAGELPGQGKSRAISKFIKHLDMELARYEKLQPTRAVYAADGTFQPVTGKATPRLYAREIDARADAGLLNESAQLSGNFVQVIKHPKGWAIETTSDPKLTGHDFDSRWVNPEMDDAVRAAAMERDRLSGLDGAGRESFEMKIPESIKNKIASIDIEAIPKQFDDTTVLITNKLYAIDFDGEAGGFIKKVIIEGKDYEVDINTKGEINFLSDGGFDEMTNIGAFKVMNSLGPHIIELIGVFKKAYPNRPLSFTGDRRRALLYDRYAKHVGLDKVNHVQRDVGREAESATITYDTSHFDMRIPDTLASTVARTAATSDAPTTVKVTTEALREHLMSGDLPPEMVKRLEALKEAHKTPAIKTEIDSIATMLGYKGTDFTEFLVTFGDAVASGKANKSLTLLTSEPLAPVLRDVAHIMGDLTKMEEFGARLGSLTEADKQIAAHMHRRFSVDKTIDAEAGAGIMAGLLKSIDSGGLLENMEAMSRQKTPLGKAFNTIAGNIFHKAARNPILKPFAEAIMMEATDQKALFTKLMILMQTDDLDVFTKAPKDDALATSMLSERLDLREKMSDLSHIANINGKTLPKLLAENHPEAQKIWATIGEEFVAKDTATGKDLNAKAAVMKMMERSYNVQRARTEITEIILRDVDAIQQASYLVKKRASGHPDEALQLVKTLDQLNPTEWMGALKKAGMDVNDAQLFLQFRMKSMGITENVVKSMKAHPEYVNEQRHGQYLVRFTDKVVKTKKLKDGTEVSREVNETGATSFETYEMAVEWIKANPKYKISKSGIEDTNLFNTGTSRDVRDVLSSEIHSKKNLLSEMFEDDPETSAAMSKMLDDVFTAADSDIANLAKKSFGKSRDFKPGRNELDMFTQQAVSMRKAVMGLTRARTDALFQLYKHDQGFKVEGGSQMLGDAQKSLQNLRTPDTHLGRQITKLGFGLHMAGNVSSMFQEIAGIPWITSPMGREAGLGFMESFNVPAKAIKELLSSAGNKKYKWDNPDHKELLMRASEDGLMTHNTMMELNQNLTMNDLKTHQMAAGIDKTFSWNPAETYYKLGAKLYAQANKVSATATLITGWEAARKMNPKATKEQLYRAAVDFHARTNGAGGRPSRPTWLPNGTLGQASWSLQSFAHTTVANWVRWIDDGYIAALKNDPNVSPQQRKQARKAANQAIVMTSMGMGVMGFPMMGALNKIIESMTGLNMERETEQWLLDDDDPQNNAHLVNTAMRGLMYSSGMPFDLQSRMAVGGVFAANAYDGFNAGQMFGSLGSIVDNTKAALGHVKRGDMPMGIASMMPTGLKRAAKLWAGDGKYMRGNEIMLDPNVSETVWSVLGFTPQKLRQSYEMADAREYFDSAETHEKQMIAKEGVKLLVAGRHEEAQRYIKEQSKLLASPHRSVGETYKSLATATANAYGSYNMQRNQTVGRSPQAMGINALYGGSQTPNAAAKYIRQQQAKGALGMQPTFNAQIYQRKQMADQAVMADPTLNLDYVEGLFGAQKRLPPGFDSPYPLMNTGLQLPSLSQ